MRRRIVKFVFLAAAGAAVASGVAPHVRLAGLASETRVVPPLADPALVPGVAHCTSDGVCMVADEHGTHRGTAPILAP